MDTIKVAQPTDVSRAAEQFLRELAGTSKERAKSTIPSAEGVQAFLLFVRANSTVPEHRVKGPITVHTLIGHARMTAEGQSFELPSGTLISFAADVVHDVNAVDDSVLLVTHALR